MKIRFLDLEIIFRAAPTADRARGAGKSPSAAGGRRAAVDEDLGEENASRPFLTDERASISSAAIPARAPS